MADVTPAAPAASVRPTSALRHAALVVGGYWLLFACLYAKPILERAYLIESDLYEYFLPLFLAPITTWSSFEFGGMPVFADPGDASFYPLHLLFRGLGSWTGLVIAAFVVAAAGTYAYVYSLTRSRAAAAAAGLIYALSEAMMEHIAHFGVLHTIAWLPLIALAIDRLRGPHARRWVPIGALLLATCFFGGNPQTFLYGGYACALYALAGGIAERASYRYYVSLVAMGVLGALLTSVKALPMLEASLYTARQTLNYGQFVGHANTATQMLSIVFPAILHEGREAPTYVGLLTLVWAVFALRQARSNWRVVFWFAVVVIALMLGAGDATPMARFAFHLPAYDKFRVAARHLYLAAFGLATLAGLGIADARRPGRSAVALVLALTALGALLSGGAWFLRSHQGAVEFDQVAGAGWMPWHDPIGNQVAFALLSAVVAAGCVVTRRSRLWSVALLAVLSMDLVHALPFSAGLNGLDVPTMSKEAAMPSTHAAQLARALAPAHQRLLAPAGTQVDAVVPAVFARVWEIPIAGGYGPMLLSRYGQLALMGTNGAVDPSVLSAQNAAADVTATKFVVMHREALAPTDTITQRGIDWTADSLDWPIGTPECGQRFARGSSLAVPQDVAVKSIALVMHLRCGEDTPQGTDLGAIDVSSGDGALLTRRLVAGVDVAEEGLGSSAFLARSKHRRADVFETNGNRLTYFLRIDLPQVAHGARLDIALNASSSALIIDRVTAIDDAGRSHPQSAASLALSDARRWRETGRFATSRTTDRGADTDSPGEEQYVVFENQRALPRAWLASEVAAVEDRDLDTAVHYSLMPDGRRFDPAATALVRPGSGATASFTPGSHSVIVRAIRDGNIRLAVSSTGGGFLVLSENNYPGWRARIDGQQTRIYETDGSLQGVVVPAGTHDVVFEFASTTLRVGAGVTAAALALAALLLWMALRRRPGVSSSTA